MDALAGAAPGLFPRRAFRSIFGLFIRSCESNAADRRAQTASTTALSIQVRPKTSWLSLTAENGSGTQSSDPSQRALFRQGL